MLEASLSYLTKLTRALKSRPQLLISLANSQIFKPDANVIGLNAFCFISDDCVVIFISGFCFSCVRSDQFLFGVQSHSMIPAQKQQLTNQNNRADYIIYKNEIKSMQRIELPCPVVWSSKSCHEVSTQMLHFLTRQVI